MHNWLVIYKNLNFSNSSSQHIFIRHHTLYNTSNLKRKILKLETISLSPPGFSVVVSDQGHMFKCRSTEVPTFLLMAYLKQTTRWISPVQCHMLHFLWDYNGNFHVSLIRDKSLEFRQNSLERIWISLR